MTPQSTCPKCGGNMHSGKMTRYVVFIPDNGAPGSLGFNHGVQIMPASACTECGFLEMYVDVQELRYRLDLPAKE